mmetsp:Transcript_10766/g.29717  ORF Transcript_10766/g.29717 Transcript_10766/m.29717 type:complete len:172 (+) Transcript_10766:3660-4175(+)
MHHSTKSFQMSCWAMFTFSMSIVLVVVQEEVGLEPQLEHLGVASLSLTNDLYSKLLLLERLLTHKFFGLKNNTTVKRNAYQNTLHGTMAHHHVRYTKEALNVASYIQITSCIEFGSRAFDFFVDSAHVVGKQFVRHFSSKMMRNRGARQCHIAGSIHHTSLLEQFASVVRH